MSERFTDLHQAGFGRNAIVVHAWDRDLGRSVAFKTTHPRELDLAAEELDLVEELDLPAPLANHAVELRARLELSRRYTLRREAELLAKIDHPNVIAVHDIGKIADGSNAVLLPFLSGGSLDERALPERWEDVLEILLQIGRGLEAIHAEGILHRDLKPNNIMFDGKGQPVIVDLGLACRLDDAEAMADWVGSLGYMSPEVARQERRDVRDDLYAFCVIAFEAFYGDLPFATLADRDAGRVRALKRESGMSAAVHDAIVRGLAPDPDARWPDMTRLLRELERARDPRDRSMERRGPRWAAIAGASLAAAASIGFALSVPDVRASECDGLAAELEEIWNDDTQAALRDALGTRKAGDGLRDWVGRWVAVRGQECEAARSRSSDLGPTPCSASLRDRFVATIHAFETPHLREELGFATVLAELPAPEHCLEHPEQSDWGVAGPAALRDVDVVVEALIRMGDLDVARDRLDEYLAAANALDSAHGIARATFWRGELHRREGRLEPARLDFERAFRSAGQLGLDALAAEAMMKLAEIAGARGQRGRVDAYALAASGVFEEHRPDRLAELLRIQGLALGGERGLPLLARAVELRAEQVEAHAGTRELLSQAQESYARGLLEVGRAREAVELLELALATHQDEFGHGTWRTLTITRNKILAHVDLDNWNDAKDTAYALFRASYADGDWETTTSDVLWFVDVCHENGKRQLASDILHEIRYWLIYAGQTKAIVQIDNLLKTFEEEVAEHGNSTTPGQ